MIFGFSGLTHPSRRMADELSSDLASLKIARDEPPSGGGATKLIVGLAGVAGVVAAGYFIGLPYLEAKVFKTEVAVTEIAEVSPAQAAVELTSTGYVVPQTVSNVAVKVPGKVNEVAVRQGDLVEKGNLLFTMDLADHDAAIAAAKSQVAAAGARVATARAEAETAKANLAELQQKVKRERRLVEAGVSPAAVVEDLEAQEKSLKQNVRAALAVSKAAMAEVGAAQAEVKALEVNRDNYSVVAPITGTVLNKPPEVGEYVGPQPAGISTDMGGVELADFETLQVETDVPEARLHLVKVGGPCEIVLDAFPTKRYRGKTSEITPRVNRAKATVIVKVEFVDSKEGVLPDMSARVSFLTGELDAEAVREPPKTIVPSSAVVDRDGAKVVFVLEDGKVRLTPVKVGSPFGGGFELLNGPAPGTRVISDPPGGLSDGQQVKEKTDA